MLGYITYPICNVFFFKIQQQSSASTLLNWVSWDGHYLGSYCDWDGHPSGAQEKEQSAYKTLKKARSHWLGSETTLWGSRLGGFHIWMRARLVSFYWASGCIATRWSLHRSPSFWCSPSFDRAGTGNAIGSRVDSIYSSETGLYPIGVIICYPPPADEIWWIKIQA